MRDRVEQICESEIGEIIYQFGVLANAHLALDGKTWVDAHVITPAGPLMPGYRPFRPHYADCSRVRENQTPKASPAPLTQTLF